MNLSEAVSLAKLREPVREIKPRTKTAVQVARKVFELAAAGGFPYKHHSPESWAKKWLCSKEFTLMEIDINAAASINKIKNEGRVAHYMHCSVENIAPIVVDYNHRKQGKTILGYIPEVVVQDGTHRKKAMLQLGHSKILAWVGCKAAKRIKKVKVISASNGNGNGNGIYLPPVDPTKIATAYEIYATTVPSVGVSNTTVRQDVGEGGSRPRDHVHGGGPGSGRKPENRHNDMGYKLRDYSISKGLTPEHQEHLKEAKDLHRQAGVLLRQWNDKDGAVARLDEADKHLKNLPKLGRLSSARDCSACGARSSGSLVDDSSNSDKKVPPDSSDAKTFVDSSDQLKWDGKKANNQAPGTKPGDSARFGSPNNQSPGSGVGPRVRNTGASNSDFSRALMAAKTHAEKLRGKGKKIPRIWDKESGKMIDAVAPPGREDQVLELKKKYGEDSPIPFKIAWSEHNEGKDA